MYKKVKKLKENIAKLYREIAIIQDSCKHHNIFYSYGANTGDVFSEDVYWIDIKCKDCDARVRYYEDEHPSIYKFKGEVGSESKELLQ